MTGLPALLRLDARLLLARPLFRTVAVASVLAALIAAATSGGEPGAGWWRVAQAVRVTVPLLLSFGAILGAVSLAGDASTGALRGVMMRPVSRTAVVTSRAIVLAAGVAAVYAVSILAAWLLAAAVDRFPSITYGTEAGAPDLITQAELLNAAPRLVLVALPALMCAALLGLMVSAFWNDPSSATICALMLVLSPYVVETVFDASSSWAFTHVATSGASVLKELAEGVTTRLSAANDLGVLLTPAWVPIACGMIAIVIGSIVFSVRDFRG